MSRVFRLGVFIVATLLILVVGVFLIGDKRFLFRHTFQISTQFQNVDGLEDGSDVQVGGIHLGTVKYISLPRTPSGKLTVVMTLSDSTKNIIRRDSIASIQTEGLLGNKYIEISFGSENGQPIENGDMINGQTPVDVSTAAIAATNQAKDTAAAVEQDANALTSQAKSTAAAFQQDADALRNNFLLKGFFERRGYEDPNELKKYALSQLPARKSSKDFMYQAKELFTKSNDAKLKDKKKLNEAGEFLEQNKFSLAVVADSEAFGDTDKDRLLTEARAKVVRDYLVQNFKIDDTRLKIIGLGKSPRSDADSKLEILVYD